MPNQDLKLADRDIGRLLHSLIRSEQDELIRSGGMASTSHIDVQAGPLGNTSFPDLSIDEEQLGFDSLARLGLVERVNRFFGLSASGIEDYLLVHRSLREWIELVGKHFEIVGSTATLTFSSSGSTGAQSHHSHTWASLVSEVFAHLGMPAFPTPKVSRALCSVPVHHIYGFLWGVLLPRAAGIDVRDLPAGAAGPLMRVARPGDMIITTPLGWETLASLGTRLREGVYGIASGGPSTDKTWTDVEGLGLAELIEIYGASETAGIGWRSAGNALFTLCAVLRMSPPGSSNGNLALFRTGRTEELVLQDHIDWTDSDKFRVLGRKDKQVQVGGVNVSPASVARTLEELPQVREAVVRLDGQRLKAFIVPQNSTGDLALLEIDIRHHMRKLPAPAQPQRFSFGQALPRSPTGKLADWKIA